MNVPKRGFTLIELLVVIAIIGLLSSVVLASLNSARTKSKTQAIKAQAIQFRNLMELEASATGSYANLNRGWVNGAASCTSAGYGGAYASQAVEICKALGNLVTNPHTSGHMYTGVNTSAGFSNTNQYSIMVRLPSGTMFCVGSSGGQSDTTTGAGGWVESGCYGNP